MGRALTLLLVAVVAIVLGVAGTVAVSKIVVTSSSDAAKAAEDAVAKGSKELEQPEGYGSR
jgi:hypothetical protein